MNMFIFLIMLMVLGFIQRPNLAKCTLQRHSGDSRSVVREALEYCIIPYSVESMHSYQLSKIYPTQEKNRKEFEEALHEREYPRVLRTYLLCKSQVRIPLPHVSAVCAPRLQTSNRAPCGDTW